MLASALELLLSKRRILEIYLNFNKPAARLGAGEAARLAVMQPSPKFFERRPGSPYLSGRAATIVARMPAVDLP